MGGLQSYAIDFGPDLGLQSVPIVDCEDMDDVQRSECEFPQGCTFSPVINLRDAYSEEGLPCPSDCLSDLSWVPSSADSGLLDDGFSDWALDKAETLPSLLGELGIYNADYQREFLSAEFEDRYSDAQGHSKHYSLLGDRSQFRGPTRGPNVEWSRNANVEPIVFFLLLFWTSDVIARVVVETNNYARKRDPDTGICKGGRWWQPLRVPEFKTFLGICVLVGVKKPPSLRD